MQFSAQFTGTQPLLMHNSALTSPFNEHARAVKAVSSKRKKTDEDHEEIARLEFQGGLYFKDDVGPVVPSRLLYGCFLNGAKLDRAGRDFTRSFRGFSHAEYRLEYEGPRERAQLWQDERFALVVPVRVQAARVMRTRPMFTDWSLTASFEVDTSLMNEEAVKRAVEKGGAYEGIGDFRQQYGRFRVAWH